MSELAFDMNGDAIAKLRTMLPADTQVTTTALAFPFLRKP